MCVCVCPSAFPPGAPLLAPRPVPPPAYASVPRNSDAKVANRTSKVWHGAKKLALERWAIARYQRSLTVVLRLSFTGLPQLAGAVRVTYFRQGLKAALKAAETSSFERRGGEADEIEGEPPAAFVCALASDLGVRERETPLVRERESSLLYPTTPPLYMGVTHRLAHRCRRVVAPDPYTV